MTSSPSLPLHSMQFYNPSSTPGHHFGPDADTRPCNEEAPPGTIERTKIVAGQAGLERLGDNPY